MRVLSFQKPAMILPGNKIVCTRDPRHERTSCNISSYLRAAELCKFHTGCDGKRAAGSCMIGASATLYCKIVTILSQHSNVQDEACYNSFQMQRALLQHSCTFA